MMETKLNTKKDMYLAISYTLLLLILAIPLSVLGLKLLNLLLGNVQ